MWVEKKDKPYFVMIGRGPGASPEIYSGGPGYLITAGGVHRGKRSMIVARPITLMLEDEAKDLKQVLSLAGPGDEYTEWNNTGVYRDLHALRGQFTFLKDGLQSTQMNFGRFTGRRAVYLSRFIREKILG